MKSFKTKVSFKLGKIDKRDIRCKQGKGLSCDTDQHEAGLVKLASADFFSNGRVRCNADKQHNMQQVRLY